MQSQLAIPANDISTIEVCNENNPVHCSFLTRWTREADEWTDGRTDDQGKVESCVVNSLYCTHGACGRAELVKSVGDGGGGGVGDDDHHQRIRRSPQRESARHGNPTQGLLLMLCSRSSFQGLKLLPADQSRKWKTSAKFDVS